MGLVKKDVIRCGDTVGIVVPTFVTRVGYPKIADDFMEEAEKTLIEKGLVSHRLFDNRKRDEQAFIRKFAHVLLARAGWGGKRRTLHTYEAPEFLGKTLKVCSKKVVKTGIHVGPSGGMSEADDFDPGYLGNPHTQILLWVYEPNHYYRRIDEVFPSWPWKKDEYLVIPAANVVKLPKG